MPETKTGLPTDAALLEWAEQTYGKGPAANSCADLLREVRARCLRWAADQAEGRCSPVLMGVLREAQFLKDTE